MPDRGGQRYDRSDSEPPVQGITFFKERQLSREQLFRDGSQSPDEIVTQSRSGVYEGPCRNDKIHLIGRFIAKNDEG